MMLMKDENLSRLNTRRTLNTPPPAEVFLSNRYLKSFIPNLQHYESVKKSVKLLYPSRYALLFGRAA